MDSSSHEGGVGVALVRRVGRRWRREVASLVTFLPMGALLEFKGDVALGERVCLRLSGGRRLYQLRATVTEVSSRFANIEAVNPLQVRVEFDCLTRWLYEELQELTTGRRRQAWVATASPLD